MKTRICHFVVAAVIGSGFAVLPLVAAAPASAQTAPYASYGRYPKFSPQFSPVRATRVYHSSLRRSANRARKTNKTNRRTGANETKRAETSKVDLGTTLAQLHLTAAQKASIDAYQAKADADGKAAYADRTLSSDQFIGHMDKIHDDLMDSIRGVLTPEQKRTFESRMAKAK